MHIIHMSFNDNVLKYLYLNVQILNMGYDYVEDNYEHFIFFTA